MSDTALVIMARAPQKGKTKTRLAATNTKLSQTALPPPTPFILVFSPTAHFLRPRKRSHVFITRSMSGP